jgi:ABC-type amino acid transport substrate-binding protein
VHGLDDVTTAPVNLENPVRLDMGPSPADPQSEARADRIDVKLAEMRESGRLQEILDRYGVRDGAR